MAGEEIKIKQIIENYLYEVTRRLPEKQRQDIENELYSLIEDMLNERAPQNAASINDLELVLNELGTPRDLANKYRENKNYIIGPEYYDKYLDVLRAVLMAVFIGSSAGSFFLFISSVQTNYYDIFGDVISTVFSSLFQAFAYVTIGFAIAERSSMSTKKISGKKEWSVNNLTKIPRKSEIIKKSESIISIVFIMIFLIFINYTPQYLGVIKIDESRTVYSIFNMDTFKLFLPLINVAMLISLICEIIKLIAGKYSIALSILITVLNFISFFFIISFFTRPELFNPEIIPLFVIKSENIIAPNTKNFTIFILAIIYVLDSGKTIYKGLKSRK